MSDNTGAFCTSLNVPAYVGGYRIGGNHGVQFNLTKRPFILHRLMMRWCFGWEWVGA
jgi:hypothetical protein